MSVSMYPGAITFTVMPREPNSLDNDFENPDPSKPNKKENVSVGGTCFPRLGHICRTKVHHCWFLLLPMTAALEAL